ncbi:tetraspanin-13 isoform X2 [Neocloeon triangulifer]|uniref:tetraspanin-13 isoform X2 n=1 Tax=Neocloeon triangulifer TaxID=2078957 RepID=UPI00286ECD67|nr:tetraspanin-13 isoform X2 [Neocloeon triangulifer]
MRDPSEAAGERLLGGQSRKSGPIMCGGFTCSRNALTALNVIYIVVAFVLISVAVYGRASSLVTDLPIVGGILACGIILFIVSIVGLVGALKHHQVMLFFYMLILFMLFIVQFAVACACLAVNTDQQKQLAETGWTTVPNSVKSDVQSTFTCCGFYSDQGTTSATNGSLGHPACNVKNNKCCVNDKCDCQPCFDKVEANINKAFKTCGTIGLVFSFTEFLGVWLTVRYRNQKDPRAISSAFL